MRLAFWPESLLLQFATKCAKIFNWLTGKGNFCFAYCVAALGSLSTPILGPLCGTRIGHVPFLFLISAICAGIVIFFIHDLEEIVEMDSGGAWHIEVDIYCLILRVGFFAMFLLSIRDSAIHYSPSPTLPQLAPMGFWVFAFYLASVQRPPFARNRVKEFFQKAIRFAVFQPIPVKA